MNRLIILFAILLFSACSVTKQQTSIAGRFKGRTPGTSSFVPSGEIILSLKPDGAFDLYWLQKSYTGIWEILDKNHLLLNFDEITDDSILLTSGVILDREREVWFINKNKIKMPGHVIKRRLIKVNYVKSGYNVLKREK